MLHDISCEKFAKITKCVAKKGLLKLRNNVDYVYFFIKYNIKLPNCLNIHIIRTTYKNINIHSVFQ